MKPAAELHEDVTRELTWDPQVAGPEAIAVAVKDGAVALEGQVEYDYQGRETDKAVRDGRGVTGIIGFIVFVRGVRELALAPSQEPFALTVTRSVNSVLFVVVVLELVRTIVARLEGGRVPAPAVPGHRHHLGDQGHPHRRGRAVAGGPAAAAGARDDGAGGQRGRGGGAVGCPGPGAPVRPA